MITKHTKHMFLLITLLLLILSISSVNADNTDNTTVHRTLAKADSNVNVSTAISENKNTDMKNGNLSKQLKSTEDINNLKTESSIIYVNSNGDDSSDGLSEDSPTTLLNAFSNIGNHGTIYFTTDSDDDIYTLNDEFIISPTEIKYGEETIAIDSELSEINLIGLEGKNITFTSNQNNHIFTIKSGISLSMNNLNFDKCGNMTEEYYGGAIYTESELNLTSCTFTDNVVGTYGGAIIYINGSIVNVKNSTFDSNNLENGAVFYVTNNGQLNLFNNTIINNSALNEASIVYNDKSIVNMTNNIIENNSGKYLLYNTESNDELTSQLNLYNNTINNNIALSDMILSNGKVIIDSNEFSNNVVTGSGYIIYNQESTLTITNNIFVNNTDDTRDMLIGGNNPSEISNNDYIDNYLNDSIDVDVDGVSVKISLNLNEIYNDTLHNGTLTVYINQKEYQSWQIDGNEYIFDINAFEMDDSVVELKIEYITQSKHYQNITMTNDVTLPTKTTIEYQILNTTWSNPQMEVTVLNINQNPLMDGNLTIKNTQTDEILFETTITQNTTKITLDPLNEINEYNFTIEFSGTESYLPCNTTIQFNTTKQQITYEEFSFENQNSTNQRAYIGEKYNFTDLLEEEYSITEGNWIISIDDQIVLNTTDFDNHQIEIPDNLTEGTHNITGDFINKFYYANINSTFTALKQTPRIITYPTIITNTSQAENIEISIISDKNVNDDLITKDSNITLLIEDLDFSITKETENGEQAFAVDIPQIGVYTIIIIFEENSKYKQVQTTIPIVLETTKTLISLNVTNNTQLLTNMTTTGQLTDINSNPLQHANITLHVNNQTYNLTTDNNGIFTKELLITSTNNNIIAEYEGNSIYKPSSNSTSFNVNKEKVEWSEFEMDENIKVETGLFQKIFSGRLVLERNKSIGVPNVTINYHIDIYNFFNVHVDTEYYTIVTDENGYFEANQYPNTKFDHQNYHKYIYDNYYPNLVISFDGDENYYPTDETKESYITTSPRLVLGLHFHPYDIIMVDGKAHFYDYIYGLEYYDYVIVSKNELLEQGISNVDVIIRIYSPFGDQNMTVTTDNDGKANFHFRVMGAGTYGISASVYSPGISASSTAMSLLLIRSNGTISLNPINGKYVVNDTVNISGKLMNSSGKLIEGNANLTLKVNNQTEAIIPVYNGIFQYDYIPLTEGHYNISLEYKGDLLRNNITVSKEFNVTKLNTSIKLSEPSNNKKVSVGTNISISGQLKDSRNINLASKEITVTLNQKTYNTITNEQGKFSIPITIQDTGILNITVSYDGDIIYNPCNATANLNSSSKMIVVFNDDENNLTETVVVGDIIIIKGYIYDNITKNILKDVDVTLNMIKYTYQTTSNQDGEFTLEIPTNAGNYNLNLIFSKDYYNTLKEAFKLNVNKKNLTLNIDTNSQDLKLADNVTITVQVMDNGVPVKNQTVYIEVNDDVYTFITDDTGIINIIVPTKMIGQNNITVSSKETSKYYKNNISTTFNVDYNTVNLEVTTDSNNTRIDDNVTIQITASDAYDNPIINHQITVNINENLSYNLTTDKEGKTNITITPDTNGQNNITAILKQSNNYLEHTKNTTFNVRKINTTLTINNTPVSIEANQNANISILVYLFDEDGNPLNNQKVNIQYGTDTISNGYTNEEGVYSFKLSRQYESSQIYINAYFDETTKYTASSNNISVTIEVPITEEDNTTNPMNNSSNTGSNSTSNDNTGYSNSSDNTNINPGNPTNNNKPNTPGKPTPPNTNPNNNENTPQTGNNQNTNNNKPNMPGNPTPGNPTPGNPTPGNPNQPNNNPNENTPQTGNNQNTNNNKPTQPNIPGNPTQPSMNPNNNENKTTPSTSNNPEHINDITNNTPNNMPDETEGNIIPEIPQNTNNTENSEDNENHNPINPPDNPNNNENTESQDTTNEDLKEDVEVSDEPKSEDNPINEEIPKEEPDEENQRQNEIQDEVKPETNENKDEQQIEDEINPQEEVSDNTQDPQDIESTDNPQETITPEIYEEPTITSSESPLIDSSDNINVEDNTIAAVATTNKAYEIIPNTIEDNISWTWLIVLIIAFGSILYGYLRFKETN